MYFGEKNKESEIKYKQKTLLLYILHLKRKIIFDAIKS